MNESILGIDLATRRYRDIGVALLQPDKTAIACQLIRFDAPSFNDPPTVAALADFIGSLAARHAVSVVAIDGPQAWKAPDNGLQHQRLSEKALRTQAKTGLPEQCKPATSLRFVRFAIDFYAAMETLGWSRQKTAIAEETQSLIEVFPTAAWRTLGLQPLPSKAASNPQTVAQWLEMLRQHFPITLQQTPSHDELQALVAGLVGLAFAQGNGYRSWGIAPFLLDGTWREGFIVNFADSIARL